MGSNRRSDGKVGNTGSNKYSHIYKAVSHQTSQYNSRYYDLLEREGRLGRFIEVVVDCSLKGYTREHTVDILNDVFRDYFSGGKLSVKTFDRMIKRYPDIANAWSARRGLGESNAFILKDILMGKAMSGGLKVDELIELLKFFGDSVFRDDVKKEGDSGGVGNNRGGSKESVDTFEALGRMMANIQRGYEGDDR